MGYITYTSETCAGGVMQAYSISIKRVGRWYPGLRLEIDNPFYQLAWRSPASRSHLDE